MSLSSTSTEMAVARPGSGPCRSEIPWSRDQGPLSKAAERFLRRQVELEDAYPFHAAPAARAEHAARLSEVQVALREDRKSRSRAG